MRRLVLVCSVAAALGVAPGCVGDIGERDSIGDPPPPSPQDCGFVWVQDSPVRRLTRWEYNGTVRDLLGDTTAPADDFTPESLQLGFINGAASTPMSATVVEEYEKAARELAAAAALDMEALLGCDPAADGEDACADAFVGSFGRRAFRRPLEQAELDAYRAFYAAQKAEHGFAITIEMLVSAFLQSPFFLYRAEFGMPDPAAPAALRLTGYEVATRLAYLLWGTTPDDELLDAAAAGELDTPEQVRARAEKMLDDDRGKSALQDFWVQWGRLGGLPNLHKNAAEFTPAVGELMLEETRNFVDQVVRHGDGTLESLLTSPVTFMNAELAAFYGIDGPSGAAFESVELDPARYAGLLTQGSFLSTLAHEAQPSPVYRGKFVLEQLVCSPPPPPPDDVNTQLPQPDPTKTLREQLEELTGVQPCKACHLLMNEPGFAFDHFDAIGRWRDDDRGLPIDTTGELRGPGDANGAFADHVELAGILARSSTVRSCMVEHWFHYAYGRGEGELDACSTGQLQEAFEASGGNVRTLLVELTQTPAFLYRVDPSKEAP